MMELSADDISKLESKGFRLDDFTIKYGDVTQLRNVGGYCYFYNQVDKKCQIYEDKPIGCCVYPVVYLVNEGMMIDELCPMGKTISKPELIRKGKILDRLLKKIDNKREKYQTSYVSGNYKPIFL
jgi:Fe-S-cluster containining protein